MEININKKLAKTGDNIVLIIPKDMVKEYKLKGGDFVEVKLKVRSLINGGLMNGH